MHDFSAVNDGIAKATETIQRALDAGGIVHIPPGTYRCGTLYLRSNGGLDLAPGATILGSADPADYNRDDFCPQNPRGGNLDWVSGAHLIVAVNAENVYLGGKGTIDGHRSAFYGDQTVMDGWEFAPGKWRPGAMLFFCESRNITLEGITLTDAPYWSCFLFGCTRGCIHDLTILNDPRTLNGDGIDIDCCSDIRISDSLINTGDDALAIRANGRKLQSRRNLCERITVTNCILKTRCQGIRVGVGTGLIRALAFSNLIIEAKNGIDICSNWFHIRSVRIEHLLFQNIVMRTGNSPLIIMHEPMGKTANPGSAIHDICFRGISAECGGPVLIIANAHSRIDNLEISHSGFEFRNLHGTIGAEDATRSYGETGQLQPDCAIYLDGAENVRFDSLALTKNAESFPGKLKIAAKNCLSVTRMACDVPLEMTDISAPDDL